MRHLVVSDLNPDRIGMLIQPGFHGQAGAGVRGADRLLDHGFVAHQRLPAPIFGVDGKKTMLDFQVCDANEVKIIQGRVSKDHIHIHIS